MNGGYTLTFFVHLLLQDQNVLSQCRSVDLLKQGNITSKHAPLFEVECTQMTPL